MNKGETRTKNYIQHNKYMIRIRLPHLLNSLHYDETTEARAREDCVYIVTFNCIYYRQLSKIFRVDQIYFIQNEEELTYILPISIERVCRKYGNVGKGNRKKLNEFNSLR